MKKKVIQADQDITELVANNNERILVVDDEPQLRDIPRRILQTLDYKVDSVSSGELAIDFVKENPVDLVIIDMLMQPGINGYQTYEKILEIYPEQKAVIASGFSDSNDVKAALRLGVAEFIQKPYSLEQLARTVREVLQKKIKT